MRITISGHGFVAKNLAERYTEHDVQFLRRGDNVNSVKDFAPEIIFHTAAEIYRDDKMFDSNVKLTYDILMATLDLNYKSFIYIGSSSEYGQKNYPITEKEMLKPKTMYAATKGCGTLLSQAFAHNFGKPIVIARPFSIYGKYEPSHRLVPTIKRCFVEKSILKITPDYVHDWIYIDDFIDGLQTLAERGESGDIVNFGSGKQYTNLEVLQAFEKAYGRKLQYKTVDRLRSFDTKSWVCDPTYAQEKYGFKTKSNLEDGIKAYVAQTD